MRDGQFATLTVPVKANDMQTSSGHSGEGGDDHDELLLPVVDNLQQGCFLNLYTCCSCATL